MFPEDSQRTAIKQAFTLIELLVVIAIIGLLAAILFPVFSRARENARRSSCQSNLKQIGLALIQYTQDYDEFMPQTHFGSTYPGEYRWMDAVLPYVKTTRLFVCPSRSRQVYREKNSSFYGGYGANFAYYNVGDAYTPPFSYRTARPLKVPSMVVPTTTIMVADVETSDTDGYFSCFEWADLATQLNPNFRAGTWHYAKERHLETLSALYCDGHVKASAMDKLAEKGSAGQYRFLTIEDD